MLGEYDNHPPVCSFNRIGNFSGELIVVGSKKNKDKIYGNWIYCSSPVDFTDTTIKTSDIGQGDTLNKLKITSVDAASCRIDNIQPREKYNCTIRYYFKVLRKGKSRINLKSGAVKNNKGYNNAKVYSNYFTVLYWD